MFTQLWQSDGVAKSPAPKEGDLFKIIQLHDSTCEECVFYDHGEELLGICTCPENRKRMGERQNE